MEEWKDIEGYEGLYQVSNEGNTKSLARDIVCKDRRIYHLEEKLLKPSVDGSGYLCVWFYKDGKVKMKKVHRLVAETFMPNPLNLPQVNHKDENKLNNTVWINEAGTVDLEKSNLEWCTHEYNQNYGTHNQRSAEGRSKKVYQYTLDGTLVKIWPSANECGRNGFNQGIISLCCNNKYMREGNNKSKGYKWSYTPL